MLKARSPLRLARASSTRTPAEMTSGPMPSAGVAAIEWGRMRMLRWVSVGLRDGVDAGGLRPRQKQGQDRGENQQACNAVEPADKAAGLVLDPADHGGPHEAAEAADRVDGGDARRGRGAGEE